VIANPEGDRLDKRRPATGAGARQRFMSSLVHRKNIVAVDLNARETISDRLLRQCLRGGLTFERNRYRPLIVLAEKDYGQRKNAGEIKTFVKISLGGGAIAEINQHRNLVSSEFCAPGSAGTDRNLRSHRNRDRKVVLSFGNLAASLIAGPVLKNHVRR